MNTIFEKGKQFEYFPNKVERIDYQKNAEPGDIIKVDRVLVHGGKFGQPYLKGITVKLEVIGDKRKKITIGKKKAKKRYLIKKGCPVRFTMVKMIGIEEQRKSKTPEEPSNQV
jgi:ribosomal protein L21